jgi:hypothetical protein
MDITLSFLQEAKIIGECVVAINWTLGKVSFNAEIIFQCLFECKFVLI